MDKKKTNTKIERYKEITSLLLKEKDYLYVVKGYSESELYSSEAIARILMMLEVICELHEQLYDQIDDLVVELGV